MDEFLKKQEELYKKQNNDRINKTISNLSIIYKKFNK